MKDRTCFCVALILVLCLPGCQNQPRQQVATGAIHGSVRTRDSAPLEGATVTTSPPTSQVITDSAGNYAITDVPIGDYLVIATTQGYGADSAKVRVVPDKTTAADIRINRLKIQFDKGQNEEGMRTPGTRLRNIPPTRIDDVPIPGLVVYWSFSGNAYDNSDHGSDGTILGPSFTEDRFGNDSMALDFNGSGDHVIVESNSRLNLTGDFTISAWILCRRPSKLGGIIGKYHSPAANGFTLRLSRSEASSGIDCCDVATPDNIIHPDEWYHVVGIHSAGAIKIYVNGAFVTSGRPTYELTRNDDPVIIGEDCASDPRYFAGKLDDIRIYGRALSLPEIRQLFRERGWPVKD